MKKVYRTAQGQSIDMDKLRLANEGTIAVGNMKVNARGDQLGPGGEVVKTRNEVMRDYYKLNTPIAVEENPYEDLQADNAEPTNIVSTENVSAPQQSSDVPAETPTSGSVPLRGSLADSVSKKSRRQ